MHNLEHTLNFLLDYIELQMLVVSIQEVGYNKKTVDPRAKVNISDLYKHGYSA